MAVLSKRPCPGDWSQRPSERLEDYLQWTEALLQGLLTQSGEAAAARQAVGIVVQFPFGDAWRIPAAHIRGLRMAEVRGQSRWIRLEAELKKAKRGED
jgi:hypothetical protein